MPYINPDGFVLPHFYVESVAGECVHCGNVREAAVHDEPPVFDRIEPQTPPPGFYTLTEMRLNAFALQITTIDEHLARLTDAVATLAAQLESVVVGLSRPSSAGRAAGVEQHAYDGDQEGMGPCRICQRHLKAPEHLR